MAKYQIFGKFEFEIDLDAASEEEARAMIEEMTLDDLSEHMKPPVIEDVYEH